MNKDIVKYKRLLWVASFVTVLILGFGVKYSDLDLGLNLEVFKLISTATGVNWILWAVFRKYLWKFSIFYPWLVLSPDLSGDWEGHITSTWVDPKTDKTLPPIETKAKIKQNLTDLTLDFTTNEMESQSTVAKILYDSHRKAITVSYIYQSDPGALVKHRSAIHYGSATLKWQKNKGQEHLKGEYWTGRKTTGTISIHRMTK